jgi:L,D-transpeptidase ErfK/SrfK
MRVSHGCIRLYPENIEYLYELVSIGEPVQIINEPFLLGELDGELIFEAHAPLEDDTISPDDRLNDLFVSFGESSTNELSLDVESGIRTLAGLSNGVPIRVGDADTDRVLDHARRVRNVVVVDPNEPTLSEVREMLDEALLEDDQT